MYCGKDERLGRGREGREGVLKTQSQPGSICLLPD